MFKDKLFTAKKFSPKASDTNRQKMLTPPIVMARNEKNWEIDHIDLRKWAYHIDVFHELRRRFLNQDLSRPERLQATKYLIKTCGLLIPLAKKGMRARWLEVEFGLIDSLDASDPVSTAITCRSLIEEASRCQIISRDFNLLQGKKNKISVNDLKCIADRFYFWIIPRTFPRTKEELKNPQHYLYNGAKIDTILSTSKNSVNDYVHPNYGSHKILTNPSDDFFDVVYTALEGCYQLFLNTPWLSNGIGDIPKPECLFPDQPCLSTTEVLKNLKDAYLKQASPNNINTEVIEDLIDLLESENQYPMGEIYRTMLTRMLGVEESIEKLIASEASSERLLEKCFQLLILQSRIKQEILRTRALESITKNTPLSTAALTRSLIEHYGVEHWVTDKSHNLLDAFSKSRDKEKLRDIARGFAKCLVGTKCTKEPINKLKHYWDALFGIQKINVIACVESSGMHLISNYNYLSSVTHGVILNGCDCLLRNDLQTHFYAADAIAKMSIPSFERIGKQIELDNAFNYIANKVPSDGHLKVANAIKIPDKFKLDRDYFGEGTVENPYYFREGFLYHTALYKFLEQKGSELEPMARSLHNMDKDGPVDKCSNKDETETIYIKNVNFISMLKEDE